MKELFKGYYQLDTEHYKELWEKSIFVFDTNVLLNSYRYQSDTRKSLLRVMEKLQERIWIPYHVGLEFQRNRNTVIAEQHKRFEEVKNAVNEVVEGLDSKLNQLQLKKRHSYINPDQIIQDILEVKEKHFNKLDELEQKSISTGSIDDIREQLDKIFCNKVGSPPKDQKEIDEIAKDGDTRFKKSIPPGYKDDSKAVTGDEFFSYAGLHYERRFGDLIIWKQIIQHARESSLKHIIFITDDTKVDWWQVVKGKTIGARPELIEEIQREAGVNNFHIYNTEGFLKYANEHLGANVKEDAIDEVRHIYDIRKRSSMHHSPSSMRMMAESIEMSVYEWLLPQFEHIERFHRFPDFIAYRNGQKYGFEVKLARDSRMAMHRLEELMYRAYHSIKEGGFHELSIILVLTEMDEPIDRLIHFLKRRLPSNDNINIILGAPVHFDQERGAHGFHVIEKISLSDLI